MVASREVSLFIFSPAAVAVSVVVVLVVKSDIGGFGGLPFGDDWEFDRGPFRVFERIPLFGAPRGRRFDDFLGEKRH